MVMVAIVQSLRPPQLLPSRETCIRRKGSDYGDGDGAGVGTGGGCGGDDCSCRVGDGSESKTLYQRKPFHGTLILEPLPPPNVLCELFLQITTSAKVAKQFAIVGRVIVHVSHLLNSIYFLIYK